VRACVRACVCVCVCVLLWIEDRSSHILTSASFNSFNVLFQLLIQQLPGTLCLSFWILWTFAHDNPLGRIPSHWGFSVFTLPFCSFTPTLFFPLYSFYFLFFAVLRIEPRALCILGELAEPLLSPKNFFFFGYAFELRALYLCSLSFNAYLSTSFRKLSLTLPMLLL
jgi:hypothetical protein